MRGEAARIDLELRPEDVDYFYSGGVGISGREEDGSQTVFPRK